MEIELLVIDGVLVTYEPNRPWLNIKTADNKISMGPDCFKELNEIFIRYPQFLENFTTRGKPFILSKQHKYAKDIVPPYVGQIGAFLYEPTDNLNEFKVTHSFSWLKECTFTFTLDLFYRILNDVCDLEEVKELKKFYYVYEGIPLGDVPDEEKPTMFAIRFAENLLLERYRSKKEN